MIARVLYTGVREKCVRGNAACFLCSTSLCAVFCAIVMGLGYEVFFFYGSCGVEMSET